MVVLREEYYQSLVRQLEDDKKVDYKSRTMGNRRVNSMEKNAFRASLNGKSLTNRRSSKNMHFGRERSSKIPIQDFRKIYSRDVEERNKSPRVRSTTRKRATQQAKQDSFK